MKRDYYWEVSYQVPHYEEYCTVWRMEVEKFVDGFQAQLRFEQLQKEDYRTRPQIKFVANYRTRPQIKFVANPKSK